MSESDIGVTEKDERIGEMADALGGLMWECVTISLGSWVEGDDEAARNERETILSGALFSLWMRAAEQHLDAVTHALRGMNAEVIRNGWAPKIKFEDHDQEELARLAGLTPDDTVKGVADVIYRAGLEKCLEVQNNADLRHRLLATAFARAIIEASALDNRIPLVIRGTLDIVLREQDA